MLGIAIAGLAVNLIGMRLLHAGSAVSLNVKGAYLEVWSDMLGSIGVIAAALVIHFTGWAKADALVAAGIGLWVLPRTWTLLRESLNILLEGVPEGLKVDEIDSALGQVAGVRAVHELHVWALTSGRNSLTAHLVIDPSQASEQAVLQAATSILRDRFAITHTTMQIETEDCRRSGELHDDHGEAAHQTHQH
jgi:cobalt-zinc-cadmium efflux system protein